jgi:hypothetical protein
MASKSVLERRIASITLRSMYHDCQVKLHGRKLRRDDVEDVAVYQRTFTILYKPTMLTRQKKRFFPSHGRLYIQYRGLA